MEREIEAQSPRAASAELERCVGQTSGGTREASRDVRIRVIDSCESWLKLVAATVDERSHVGYAGALGHFCMDYRDADNRRQNLGDRFRETIVRDDVQAWANYQFTTPTEAERKRDAERHEEDLRKRDRRPYSLDTVKGWVRVFSCMAKDQGWPLDLDRLRWPELAAKRVKTTLAPAEQERVLAQLRELHPHDFALLATKQRTGQRWSAVCALQIDDVNEARRGIRFERKSVRGRVGAISSRKPAPKWVDVDESLIEVLREQRERVAVSKVPNPKGWLFPSSVGKPRHTSSIYEALRECLKAAGINRWVSPQGFRRVACDNLRLAGVDQKTAADVIGHVDLDVHADYQTTSGEERRAALAKTWPMVRLVKEGT